jgi:hypothetical protein
MPNRLGVHEKDPNCSLFAAQSRSIDALAPLSGADPRFESSNFNWRGDYMNVVYGWLRRTACAGIGFGMILAALSTPAFAVPHLSPEIDAGSMVSAMTLLTGGVLILTGRRPRH